MRIGQLGNNYDKSGPKKKDPSERSNEPVDNVVITGNLKTFLESNALKDLASQIKKNHKLTISATEKEVIVKDEGPGIGEKIKEGGEALIRTCGQVSRVGLEGIADAIKHDTSSAFKLAVSVARKQEFLASPPRLAPTVDSVLYPVIRFAGAGIDTYEMVRTFKDKEATGMDKAARVVHLITDAAGIAGIALGWVGMGGTAATVLNAIGYSGDFMSLGYHLIRYFEKKGEVIPTGNTTSGEGIKPSGGSSETTENPPPK
ncbi:MAG TPA: hypothetical protein PL110_02715 [Candidatus Eremiobacteraeota bacterium]|nr:MAG: hypothetical protein BWY64_00697 [bacterium ADurb.Bin363]HPZ06999.1 hypothetical protein [Candidatus Eremiobacteraeota bacterium]